MTRSTTPEPLSSPSPTSAFEHLSPVETSGGSTEVAARLGAPATTSPLVVGRVFIHPIVDLLLICGGFSVPLLFLDQPGASTVGIEPSSMLWIFIACNYAHFAASTLRLYLMPHGRRQHPFLSLGLPGVALLAVLAAVTLPDLLGRVLIALYLTWSPFHYAGQAYGLALMYGYRSGLRCTLQEKRWLRMICLLPFLRALINPRDTSVTDIMGVRGVLSLLPDGLVTGAVAEGLTWGVTVLTPLIFVLPIVFAFYKRTRLTLLGLALVLINGLWLVAFSLFEGAVWATVAHSIQYLVIVSFAHSNDSRPVSGARSHPTTHMLAFYLLSVALGVPLFVGLPPLVEVIGGWLGQEWSTTHCVIMTVVAINLHHFIVDGYIWRARPQTGR